MNGLIIINKITLGSIKEMKTFANIAQAEAIRYVVNAEFNQAVLFFTDGSHLQFEHKGRKDRWAKASAQRSIAERVCQALRLFRLNAKHLQLYFEDGSEVEFVAH